MAGYNVQAQAAIKGVGHLDLLVDGILGVEPTAKSITTPRKAGLKTCAGTTCWFSKACGSSESLSRWCFTTRN